MSAEQVLLSMLLLHIFADFTLQGLFRQLKQKAWWRTRTQLPMYRNDYIVANALHALYWSLLVCLPFWDCPYVSVAVVANTAVHAVVDDAKANRHVISLLTDQLIHIGQIAFTFAVFYWGH